MISYVIRTNYSREREFLETIKAIERQQGKKEIIVVGILPEAYKWNVRYIDDTEHANKGETSRMRDIGIAEAKGEYIVCMDDDIIINTDFQAKINEDIIQVPACYNIRGGRYWDWCVIDHLEYGLMKTPYYFPYCEYTYLPGQCFIIRADVAKANKHDYVDKLHKQDDVAYSRKLQKAGYEFRCNSKCVCVHNDTRYTDWADGKGVRGLNV